MKRVRLGANMIERESITRGYPVHSVAIICPCCLTHIFNIEVEGEATFELQPTSCEDCNRPTDLDPVPGSILGNPIFADRVDWELLDLLPVYWLRREFELTLAQFDKETARCQPNESAIIGAADRASAAYASTIASSTPG